jgi:bifunctional non-homologous end joining protein LigD
VPGQRPGSWVKKKIQQTDEFIVGGYKPGTHGVDELLVGKFSGKQFMFAECVKNGFVPATRRHVHEAIKVSKGSQSALCESTGAKGSASHGHREDGNRDMDQTQSGRRDRHERVGAGVICATPSSSGCGMIRR